MNSYFDDNTQTASVSGGGSTLGAAQSPTASAGAATTAAGSLDKTSVEADLSKIFDQGTKPPVVSAPTPAKNDFAVPAITTGFDKNDPLVPDPIPLDKPISSGPSIITGASLPTSKPAETGSLDLNKTPELKVDDTPKKVENSTPTSTPASGGSLSNTESKLKSKKDELSKQITEIEGKLKKVDDTLVKIADLRKQEDEILKTANEI